jgi:hypothetical protein
VSACDRCHDSGFVAVCVEPMAGLAGYESEPCGCEPIKRLPMTCCNFHTTGGHVVDECDTHTAHHVYGYGPGEREPT